MRAAFSLLIVFAFCTPTWAADEFKIIQLEQDVRDLERQVQTLSRQIAELRSASRGGEWIAAPPTREAPTATTAGWLSAANWRRIREGMTEAQVLEALGPPTSQREEGDRRVLFYALELAPNAFLSGSVTLREGEVVDVSPPALK